MPPRSLPGKGLQAYETAGESGWNAWTDTNWRIVSAWLQARVKSVVAAVPVSPVNGDMHILTTAPNANALAIRDNGAWVYLTPLTGHRVYDEETQLTFLFDGTIWSPEFADLTATATAPALNLRKRGSAAGALSPTGAFNTIGAVQFTGWSGSVWRLGAQILAQTQQLWSGTVAGSGLVFQVVANGTTGLLDKMRLTAAALWVDAPITGPGVHRLPIFCGYGGTANAVTLTYGVDTLFTGQQVRFRATSANTGATTINLDGTGAIACRTVSGAVLPSGYIRTGVDTVATYDGTNWVVEREIERGTNAFGEFTKWADGTMTCTFSGLTQTCDSASGSIFMSATEATWTLPHSFVDSAFAASAAPFSATRWANARVATAGSVLIRHFSGTTSGVAIGASMQAVGRWY